jgi:hypothetical protein
MLDRLAHRCERNSVALSLGCLRQAARECSGMSENRKRAPSRPPAPQQTTAPSPTTGPAAPRPTSEPAMAAAPQRPTPPSPTPEPIAPQPPASPASASQRAVLSAPLPLAPRPAGISPERYAELRRRFEATQAEAASAVASQPTAQPVTGSSRISTVPPAS